MHRIDELVDIQFLCDEFMSHKIMSSRIEICVNEMELDVQSAKTHFRIETALPNVVFMRAYPSTISVWISM